MCRFQKLKCKRFEHRIFYKEWLWLGKRERAREETPSIRNYIFRGIWKWLYATILNLCTVINHFSQFLLVNLLSDMLEPKSRVVAVASGAHRVGKLDFLYWEKYESEEKMTQVLGSGMSFQGTNYKV